MGMESVLAFWRKGEPMIHLYYLTWVTERMIVGLTCEKGEFDEYAEVIVPFLDADGKNYAIHCRVLGRSRSHVVVAQGMLLVRFGRLLARRGGRDEQWENVAAIYQYDSDPKPGQQAWCEFSRPQDFAVRGLDKTIFPYRWQYRLLNYIVVQSMPHRTGELRAGTSYLVNAYIDVPTEAPAMMEMFSGVFPMMAMQGDPRRVVPMRPTDCLREDDCEDCDE